MKPSKFPLFVWLFATIFFALNISMAAKALPPEIVTHLDAANHVDGTMTRDQHILSFFAMGIGMSVFIIGLSYAIRWLPARKFNVPNKEHWQKPANRPDALAFLFYHSFWMGTLSLAFIAAVHYFTITANKADAATFAARGLQTTSIVFIIGTVAWCFFLVRFFLKAPASSPRRSKR